MKKSLFLIPCLAATLWSCSDKDVVGPDNNNGNPTSDEVEYSYLAVDIVNSQPVGSRASDNQDFTYGTSTENKVNFIRFYFFGKDGKAVAVKANGATYYDAKEAEISQTNETTTADTPDGNVESHVKTIVVIERPKGDSKPYFMAAVINNTDAPVLAAAQDDISKLQGTDAASTGISNYSSITKGFVMSSSVHKDKKQSYAEGDVYSESDTESEERIMVPVFGNIKDSRLAAENSPATIYVERVLAKVSAQLGTSLTETTITLSDESVIYKVGDIDEGAEEGKEGIYVKFLGWNTTATRNTSRLVKKLDLTTWANNVFDAGWNSLSWNDVTHHRSYWAVNPLFTSLATDYTYGDFGQGTKFNDPSNTPVTSSVTSANYFPFVDNSNATSGDKKPNWTYLQENAGNSRNSLTNDELSKIIVAAQLVDEDGNPLDLIEWGGDVYKKSDALMNAIAAATDIYVVTEGTNEKVYTQLRGTDIKLIYTPAESAQAANGTQNYYVTIELTGNDNTRYAVYKYDTTDGWHFDVKNSDASTLAEFGYSKSDELIKSALAGVGKIKYWNSGLTYYWVDIEHLGGDVTTTSEGEPEATTTVDGIGKYGVVRNHWYHYTFTSVKGLGVPVADPSQKIYPEKPDDPDLFYLAAKIEILSWKMVYNDDTQLGW